MQLTTAIPNNTDLGSYICFSVSLEQRSAKTFALGLFFYYSWAYLSLVVFVAFKLQMQAVNSSVHTHTPSVNTQAYSPSVPLSVYKELSAELQAAQAQIDALSAQNHKLIQDNQLLRQEIAKVVHSVLHLQNLLDSPSQTNYHQVPRPSTESKNDTQRQKKVKYSQVRRSRPNIGYRAMEIPSYPSYMVAPVFFEGQEVATYPFTERKTRESNNWWLFLGIMLVVCLGFGAGYLIVRPFFAHQNP